MGRAENTIPGTVLVNGEEYTHLQTLKADTIAATCIYKGPRGRSIVKTGRPHPVLLFLARSVARYLIRREAAILKRLDGIEGVPRLLDEIPPCTFVREHVPGRDLHRRKPVPDDFFDRLLVLLQAMHARGVVHIDIEKPENILLGDDGAPYLIDFQISFCLPHVPAFLRPLAAPFFRRMVKADLYHFYKHKRRIRPDLTTPEEERMGRHTGLLLAVHRVLTKPYFFIRRKFVKVRGEERPPGGWPTADD